MKIIATPELDARIKALQQELKETIEAKEKYQQQFDPTYKTYIEKRNKLMEQVLEKGLMIHVISQFPYTPHQMSVLFHIIFRNMEEGKLSAFIAIDTPLAEIEEAILKHDNLEEK